MLKAGCPAVADIADFHAGRIRPVRRYGCFVFSSRSGFDRRSANTGPALERASAVDAEVEAFSARAPIARTRRSVVVWRATVTHPSARCRPGSVRWPCTGHGLLVTQDRTGKGLQTAIKRPKKMAQARRNKPPRRGQSKRDIYRRDQANPTRRLITLSPTFGHS